MLTCNSPFKNNVLQSTWDVDLQLQTRELKELRVSRRLGITVVGQSLGSKTTTLSLVSFIALGLEPECVRGLLHRPNWKLLSSLSQDAWVNLLEYFHKLDYYSAIKSEINHPPHLTVPLSRTVLLRSSFRLWTCSFCLPHRCCGSDAATCDHTWLSHLSFSVLLLHETLWTKLRDY